MHLIRELWNGVNKEIDRQYGIEMNRVLLGDVVDDRPVVKRRLDWIHRSYARIAEWGETSADEDESHVVRAVNQVFDEANGEKTLSYPEPWRNAGWYDSMTSWSRGVLERRNMMMTGRIRQRLVGSLSVVMTCEVKMRRDEAQEGKGSGQVLFIKSTFSSVREAERTFIAATVIGNIVPEIFGVDLRSGVLMQPNVWKVTTKEGDYPFDQYELVNTVLKM